MFVFYIVFFVIKVCNQEKIFAHPVHLIFKFIIFIVIEVIGLDVKLNRTSMNC
jgi:hypothetical protein